MYVVLNPCMYGIESSLFSNRHCFKLKVIKARSKLKIVFLLPLDLSQKRPWQVILILTSNYRKLKPQM